MDAIISKIKHNVIDGDELVSIVLKGHLLIEEQLDLIINRFLPNPKAVNKAKFSFYNKTVLAQAICWRRPDNEMWPLIYAINTLRNDLAHNLESEKREDKFNRVLKIHTDMSVNDPDYENILKRNKEEQFLMAIAHVLGFLEVFKEDVEVNSGIWHKILKGQEKLLNELNQP